MADALSPDDVTTRLDSVAGWDLEEGGEAITRVFTFPDFVVAFGFMASAALVAEKLNHHPEWSNVWNRVTVRLTTHDAGGLTDLDFTLADKMSGLAAGVS